MTYQCIIVGAGPAGLSAGYFLKKYGINFIIVEKGDGPGDSWRRMPEWLRLLTPASVSALPGLLMPLPRTSYPTRDEYHSYLKRYAEHFALPIFFSARVSKVSKNAGTFSLETSHGTFSARTVIVASGLFSYPFEPEIQGRDTATIPILHSASYRKPGDSVGGRVLVLGAGNTAAEISREFADDGRQVFLSSPRGSIFAYPHRVFGLDFHFFSQPFEFFGRLSKKFFGVSYRAKRTPIIGRAIWRYVRTGRVNIAPAIREISGTSVIFSDGRRENVDSIIFATGYRYATPFLGNLTPRDSRGEPEALRGVSSVPGLFFVGVPNMSGPDSAFLRGIGKDARIVARSVGKFLATHS